ncbi:hypothetical protein F4804DRAFT_343232 [Jackrogersella minutella]|nr:hypothetical protein F4804DRAFT_343232 [Jackrogersella minutella]
MRLSVTFIQAFVALTLASPVIEPRQGIDTSLVNIAPTPTSASIPIGPTADSTTYNLTKATESATASPLPVGTDPVSRRHVLPRQTACQPLPTGAGPIPTPDTDSSFVGYDNFSTAATQATTPSNYTSTFVNLHARSDSYGYLGFDTVATYDTQDCATQCSSVWRGCQGFNIFFERDPSVQPGPNCRDPPSTTNIKCVYWGGDVSTETASNDGQYIGDFHVVIAGSNGYMKTAIPTIPGYDGEATGNSTIDAPDSDTGESSTGPGRGTYIGSKIFTNTYFDPALCAAACDAQNQNNLAHPPGRGRPQICRFFTTYLLYKNGDPVGQYCALYTQYYSRSFATNSGTRSGGNTLAVRHAFSYKNNKV